MFDRGLSADERMGGGRRGWLTGQGGRRRKVESKKQRYRDREGKGGKGNCRLMVWMSITSTRKKMGLSQREREGEGEEGRDQQGLSLKNSSVECNVRKSSLWERYAALYCTSNW